MRTSISLLVLVLAAATGAGAETYLVEPDGSGDYATIQAALNAAEDGDIIELADGTFTGDGNRNIEFYSLNVTVRSQSGNAAACIVSPEGGEGLTRRAFYIRGTGSDFSLENITVTGGSAFGSGVLGFGGALLIEDEVSPTITGCVFSSNQADQGGAIFAENHCAPAISGCTFANNTATSNAGALCLTTDSAPTIESCTFYGNSAQNGGALMCQNSAAPTLTNCTFHGNGAFSGGGTVWTRFGASPAFELCIIAFSTEGAAVACEGTIPDDPTFVCCDIYGNAGGDWVGCIAGLDASGGNICADPIFCDAAGGDFTLRDDSPCTPSGECGLMGAEDIGCSGSSDHVCCIAEDCQLLTELACQGLEGIYHPEWDVCEPNPCLTPVQEKSWGGIKARYR